MIVTITLNPSVDISYYIDSFEIDKIHRTAQYRKTAGGKGINVAKVLRQLGCETIATGFLGGTNGRWIEEQLDGLGLQHRFVQIEGNTRNCIAILSKGTQTEILESGPTISDSEQEQFLQSFRDLLMKYKPNVVTASGSLPNGIELDFYAKLIEISQEMGSKFLLDTSGVPFAQALAAKPYLIKPNISELENYFQRSFSSESERMAHIEKLYKTYQIPMIVVSLGAAGAMALCEGQWYKVLIPRVQAVNPVGSGDSLVAGMASEIAKGSSFEEILKVGNTCGILNAMNEATGEIDMKCFSEIHGKIQVTPL